jgi:hypothetical protein
VISENIQFADGAAEAELSLVIGVDRLGGDVPTLFCIMVGWSPADRLLSKTTARHSLVDTRIADKLQHDLNI